MEALSEELRYQKNYLEDEPLETIYIGGGTPSLYPPTEIQKLIDTIKELWSFEHVKEITIELNPDDVDEQYLSQLLKTQVNRLSLGVQSFIDRDLKFMSRRHSAQGAYDSVKLAQAAGYDNVTIDLIYGIPGMTLDEWGYNIDRALSLGVQHFSAYHLTVEPNTPLQKLVKEGKVTQIEEDMSVAQFDLLNKKLTGAGFEHYEVSNFALPGRRSAHNSAYWSGAPYLGVGPSAHSYNGSERYSVESHLSAYLKGVGTPHIYNVEKLSERDKYNEFVMVSFRRAEGVSLSQLRSRFGEERLNHFLHVVEEIKKEDILIFKEDSFRIPPHRFLLSDWVIFKFFI